jgi:hypothetical protein
MSHNYASSVKTTPKYELETLIQTAKVRCTYLKDLA